MRYLVFCYGLAGTLGMLGTVGCGRAGPATYPVVGMVTFDGQPLPEGRISLVPESGSVSPVGGRILQGQFRLRAQAGRYRVEIVADRPTGKPDPIMGMAPRECYIPACYNSHTILRAEVSPTGPNQFTFPLSSQGAAPPQ